MSGMSLPSLISKSSHDGDWVNNLLSAQKKTCYIHPASDDGNVVAIVTIYSLERAENHFGIENENIPHFVKIP